MRWSVKSTPPVSMPSGGIITSLRKEETIFPNAPPMITPTAMSTTLPLTANSLNSSTIFMDLRSLWDASLGDPLVSFVALGDARAADSFLIVGAWHDASVVEKLLALGTFWDALAINPLLVEKAGVVGFRVAPRLGDHCGADQHYDRGQ